MWDWSTYFIFGLSLLWAVVLLRKYSNKKRKWGWLWVAFLPMFFLHAFRAETVGTDLPNYMRHVEEGGWFLYNNGKPLTEILSQLLFYVSHQLNSFHSFLFLSSLLEFFFLGIAVIELKKKNIESPIVIALMYSYVGLRSVSMVRNGIALSVSLCALAQLFSRDKKSTWKYWIYAIVALGFHNSAIMLVPMYFICQPLDVSSRNFKTKMSLRVIGIVMMGLILFYLGQTGFLELFFVITGDTYNNSHFEERGTWGLGNLLVRLPFLLLTLYSIPRMRRSGYNYMPFILLLLLDIVVSQTKYISQDFERLTMYTGIGELIVWGMLYRCYTLKQNTLVKLLFFLLCAAYFSYYMREYAIFGSDGEGNGLMPYNMWF